MRIEGKLPVGAYLLEAGVVRFHARDLFLITDASLVLKSSAKQALVYFCNALTGAPIANACRALGELLHKQQVALAQTRQNDQQRRPRAVSP